MDKKVVLTAAIVVAFLLSSSILVLFYNQDTEDKEINLIARVNTEGSGIYIDAKYEASDFIVVDSEGNPLPDADGNIQYHKEFWEGKIFGTPGSTAIQHVQLRQIVESMGYTFTLYTTGANTSAGCNTVYYTADFDPGHTCCVIGASHDFITHNSDVTVRFLAAYIESVEWVNNAIADKSSEDYAYLVDLAIQRTGITDRTVIEASLDSVTYTYGYDQELGDTQERPLASLESSIADLVQNLNLTNKISNQGFSSPSVFAQRYVNDGYLSQAISYEKNPSGYSMRTITVAVIAGDIHQIAVHLGNELGIFESYGINLNVSSASNGAGVATSLQNGEADVGFVGAPPMTTTVVNGGLIPA